MIIPCFRCGKKINAPDSSNADYVVAEDTVVKEPREVLIALKHNQATLAKEAKMKETVIVKEPKKVLYALQENDTTRDMKAMGLEVSDDDYTQIEIEEFEDKNKLPDVVKVIIKTEARDTEKPRYPDLTIDDSEYDAEEVPNVEAARDFGEDLVKVIAEIREKDIQKTGVICPQCHRPTDFVIWGVHKVALEGGR